MKTCACTAEITNGLPVEDFGADLTVTFCRPPEGFKAGDVVKDLYWGVQGVLQEIPRASTYPLSLSSGSQTRTYTILGHHNSEHLLPCLSFISRPEPKKKVKRTIDRWVVVYADTGTITYSSEALALRHANGLPVVRLQGHYEVEE